MDYRDEVHIPHGIVTQLCDKMMNRQRPRDVEAYDMRDCANADRAHTQTETYGYDLPLRSEHKLLGHMFVCVCVACHRFRTKHAGSLHGTHATQSHSSSGWITVSPTTLWT